MENQIIYLKEINLKNFYNLDEYANINYNKLKDDEKKLLLLFKTTFELKRLQKINEKEEFQNEEDKRLYGTTVEYQNIWKNYEINDKFSEL